MTALDLCHVYQKLADEEKDTRWKRHLLQLAEAFRTEYFKRKEEGYRPLNEEAMERR